MIKHILIVCVGNICRSPIAEALLRERSPGGVVVSSAGISALEGEPADPMAVRLMQGRDIDITAHRARQVVPEMICDADLILVMEQEHVQALHSISPVAYGRVHPLGRWTETDIPDPYKRSTEYFAHVFEMLDRSVNAWSAKLWCRED